MDEKTRNELNAAARADLLGACLGDVNLGGMFYDRAGTPIGLGDWAVLSRDWEYRRVALTMVSDYRVSTVWLGINHAFLPGPPDIFETKVSSEAPEGGRADAWWDLQERYSTEEQALEGHERIVAHVRALATIERP